MIDLNAEAMNIKTDGLFLCVLGPSGAGKSHFIGTYPEKTLLLYGRGESHGPASAIKNSPNLLPVSWSHSNTEEFSPKDYIKRLHMLMNPEAIVAAGVKCIAIDSFTNLCLDIKETSLFKQRCQARDGSHNVFKETEALIEILTRVMGNLHILHEKYGIDVIVTMDLQINCVDADGIIIESKPGLPTFGVGKAIIQQFPDILVLARIKGEPVFQSLAKTTAKSINRESKSVVKYLEFNPRLRGVNALPPKMKPTVDAIFKLKNLK